MPVFVRRPFDTSPRYLAYLQSPEWKARRTAVLKRCGGNCERCRRYLVDEVHHLTYARVYHELTEDLQGLCKPCHRFLHGDSFIDPLARAVRVKVTARAIEYWDGTLRSSRRIRIAALPREQFRWVGIVQSDGSVSDWSLDGRQIGIYQVPAEVFLGADGEPEFCPERWQGYRVGYTTSRHWFQSGYHGRAIPEDPAAIRSEVEEVKRRTAAETRRRRESPASFTNYSGQAPTEPRAVMALFRRTPRIVAEGREAQIRSVRQTKRWGVVLDLECELPDGGWMRWKQYDADRKLREGLILFDHERRIWLLAE
jgi:hypothetical protein